MEFGQPDPVFSYSMLAMFNAVLNLVVYGTLIVLGLIWRTRSGGFLAAGALLVFAFGNLVAGLLTPTLGMSAFMLPTLLGLMLLLGAVAMNVQRHRTAQ